MQDPTYDPRRDSVGNADYLQLLTGYTELTNSAPHEINQANSNRRRTMSDDDLASLGLYGVFSAHTRTPVSARTSNRRPSNRRSSLELFRSTQQTETNLVSGPSTPASATIHPAQPTTEQISNTIQFGILNLLRTVPESGPQRASEVALRVRINMGNLYLKFIIQALLYLVTAMLLLTVVTWCCKISAFVLISLAMLGSLHMAARRMHQPDNRLHEENAHQAHSLFQGQNWTEKYHEIIDSSANYAVGFFSGLTRRLANTSALDQQIQHIPDNSLSMT